MELWTALILGLAGSTHCAGMCGPLVLALPSPERRPWAHLLGRLLYNLGRLLTYCGLGLLFGVLGRSLALAGVQRWVSIVAGIGLLAGVLLWRHLGRWLPGTGLTARLQPALAALLRRRSLAALFSFGALNGLLPCGLVYVACAGAVAVGDTWGGVAYMAVFGLGTVPMMLALGLAGRLVPVGFRLRLQRIVPYTLALVAGLLILRGLSLGIPYVSPKLGSHRSTDCCTPPEGGHNSPALSTPPRSDAPSAGTSVPTGQEQP